jgi:hypothetical protein
MLPVKETGKFYVDVEDRVGRKERMELSTEEYSTEDLHWKYVVAPWVFLGAPFMYRRIGGRIMRVRQGQEIHGGTIYTRPEDEEI